MLRREYNSKCDIWSCGVMLYIMLVGVPPFKGNTSREIMESVKVGKFDLKILDTLSREAKDIILNLLQYDPAKRIDAKTALEHPFIKSNAPNASLDVKSGINVLKQLSAFNSEKKLEEATLSYIIHFLVDKKDLDELKRMFVQFDANNDGYLSIEEITDGYTAIYGVARAQEAKELFTKIDKDNSNNISYDGWSLSRIPSGRLQQKEGCDQKEA